MPTGDAYSSGHLVPSLWDFICSTCWDQSFSELVVILPDYALRISLGTFSILHLVKQVSLVRECVLSNCYIFIGFKNIYLHHINHCVSRAPVCGVSFPSVKVNAPKWRGVAWHMEWLDKIPLRTKWYANTLLRYQSQSYVLFMHLK